MPATFKELIQPRAAFRFDALDGLRGVAAIAVMFYHYSMHNGLHWLPGAWAAVDLFFVLSGFVIAHSYMGKIAEGMTLGAFCWNRLKRLWPLAFIGLLLGLAAAIFARPSADNAMPPQTSIAIAAALGTFWIPYFNRLAWPFGSESVIGPVFPLNDPAWSLFFELAINIVFWFWVHRTRCAPGKRVLAMCYAAFLVTVLTTRSLNPGWGSANFRAGFPRVFAEFFLGSWLYSNLTHRWLENTAIRIVVPTLMVALFATGRPIPSLVNVLFFVPMCVALLAKQTVNEGWRRLCAALGELSFPLYVAHVPIYRLLYLNDSFMNLAPVQQTVFAAAVALMAAKLLSWFDSWLRLRILHR